MSVYYKEKAEDLRQSIDSMLCQTVPPHDFVLVCDGPLGEELEEVVTSLEETALCLFTALRLPESKGLGNALRAGLPLCRCTLVARMDSDDIALPDRCEKQLKLVAAQTLDLCSGTVEEFGEGVPAARRVLPQAHSELIVYARSRNPMNHPCVMFCKETVLQAGSYNAEFPLFEDYALWVRMIQNGARLGNHPDVLLRMRTDNGLYKRRGGLRYCRLVSRFWRHLYRTGFIPFGQLLRMRAIRCGVCLLPSSLRRILYREKLRS